MNYLIDKLIDNDYQLLYIFPIKKLSNIFVENMLESFLIYMKTAFTSKNSSNPYLPPSLPIPECL